jgi:lipoate-protein ligase A
MPLMPRAVWRLVHTAPASGAWNMAVDEAILEGIQNASSPPTLRLYAWEPTCLSLGYAQSINDVDESALASHGWELVRRPTGGRAILHTDELTYSVIAAAGEPRLAGSVLESYQRLSQALLRALELLQVPARGQEKKTANGAKADPNPVCFEAPSDYEITVEGKKLVGSAQARRKLSVLQHGSLPLHGDIARITQALVYPGPDEREAAAQRVRERAATVEGALGRRIAWEQAAAAFAEGFGESLNIEFTSGELSAEEAAAAERWMQEKYAHPDWTRRV